MLFDDVEFQAVDISFFGPAAGGQNASQFLNVKLSVGIQKFGLRINDFADQVVADADVKLVGRAADDGVSQGFLHNSLQHGIADVVVDVEIIAEQTSRHLHLLLQPLRNVALQHFVIVNLDNRTILACAADIARHAEQRHKADRGKNQNKLGKPSFLHFSKFIHHSPKIL